MGEQSDSVFGRRTVDQPLVFVERSVWLARNDELVTVVQSGESLQQNVQPFIFPDLRQAIGDCGTGLVAPKADAGSIVREIRTYFSDTNIKTLCISSIRAEKERLSWKTFCKRMLEFSDNLYKQR